MTVLQKKKKNTYVYKKNSSNNNFPVPRVHCVATKVHLNFFSSSSYCSGTWLQNDSCRRSSKKQNKLTVHFPLSEGQFQWGWAAWATTYYSFIILHDIPGFECHQRDSRDPRCREVTIRRLNAKRGLVSLKICPASVVQRVMSPGLNRSLGLVISATKIPW